LFTRKTVSAYAQHYLAGHDPRDELISPVFADLIGLPPLLIQVGSHEVLLDDAVRLATRAAESEVDVALEVVAGVPHVFQLYAGMLDKADEALDRGAVPRPDTRRAAGWVALQLASLFAGRFDCQRVATDVPSDIGVGIELHSPCDRSGPRAHQPKARRF
jgi:acetyl esterase/lipase